MPNTGQKSPNCHLCRQRRVKCDLTRPACLRCTKYGVPCPGYRKEGDVVFKNQIGVLAKKKSTRVSAQKRGKPKGSELLVNVSTGDICPLSSSLPLPTSSAAFVLRRFASSSHGSLQYGELWDFLPDLYNDEKDSSCLITCSDTFRQACIANEQGLSNNRESLLRSAKLIGAANQVMRHQESRVADSTLLSIWLLALYELLLGDKGNESMPAPPAWHTHVEGLASLIKLRGDSQFAHKRGRGLFFMAFGVVQIRSLMLDIECPAESKQWLHMLKHQSLKNDDAYFFACDVHEFMCNICTLLPQIKALATTNNNPSPLRVAELISLFDRAEELEEPMLSRISQISPSPYICPIAQLGLRNVYRAARCKMWHWLIRACDIVIDRDTQSEDLAFLNDKRRRGLSIISAMAEGILEDAATVLKDERRTSTSAYNEIYTNSNDLNSRACWMDAIRLLWPLTFTARNWTVPRGQRERARQLLGVIGSNLGIFEARKYSGLTKPSFCVF
ncbi:hypothetical protein F5Y18DRAFT_426371 [Xylariaceae sp. FL1019]|nr:hypothetical protein F5Y18DRAFT_426371 [Xylariaceae sp. FL1019]